MKSKYYKLKIALVFLFLLVWYITSSLELVKPIFLPPLTDVFQAIVSLFTEEQIAILSTLYRIVFAFFVGCFAAIPLGLLLGSNQVLYEGVEWFIDFFRSIPVTAMFPLFLIFFGFGDTAKISMGAWACAFIILINTIHGVWNVKRNRIHMAITKRATALQLFKHIIIWDIVPHIFIGMRTAISWTLIVIIVAEMFIGASHGIGRYIYDASILFDTATVFSGIIVIGCIGLGTNRLLLYLERRLFHWRGT